MPYEYEEWTNYETYLVNSWLEEEGWSNEECRRIALSKAGPIMTGDSLRDFVDDTYTLPTKGFAADLARAALERVNWRELGEHWYEAAHECEND